MYQPHKRTWHNLAIISTGLFIGLALSYCLSSEAVRAIPRGWVSITYMVSCLFGSLLSFYFSYRVLKNSTPLVLPSWILATVFVLPVAGLLLGRYLTTGQAPYLILAVCCFVLLWFERWNTSLVGAPLRYAGNTLKCVLDLKGFKYSQANSFFLIKRERETVLRLGNYLATAHLNVSEQTGAKVLNEIVPSLKDQVEERKLPRHTLSWGRHLFWGCLCLAVVTYAAAFTSY